MKSKLLIDEIRYIRQCSLDRAEAVEETAQRLYVEFAEIVRSVATDLSQSSVTLELNAPGLVENGGAFISAVANRIVELFEEQGLTAGFLALTSYHISIGWDK